jgi:hypothetical protein
MTHPPHSNGAGRSVQEKSGRSWKSLEITEICPCSRSSFRDRQPRPHEFALAKLRTREQNDLGLPSQLAEGSVLRFEDSVAMRKAPFIALVLVSLCVKPASALDIKNIRATYGQEGSVRTDNKLMLGDILILSFDIEDLKMEPHSGIVRYTNRLELLDSSGKVIYTRNSNNQRVLCLGKARVADRAQVILGTDQAPGKYSLRLTVIDVATRDAKGNSVSKSFTYPFQTVAPTFGLIHVNAPSVSTTIKDYQATCTLVGAALDKSKMIGVEIRTRLLDEKGQPTLTKPFVLNFPADLPPGFKVTKDSQIPLPFPLSLNRPGRFTVEIEAEDLVGKRTAKVSFPIIVLEPSAVVAP